MKENNSYKENNHIEQQQNSNFIQNKSNNNINNQKNIKELIL